MTGVGVCVKMFRDFKKKRFNKMKTHQRTSKARTAKKKIFILVIESRLQMDDCRLATD